MSDASHQRAPSALWRRVGSAAARGARPAATAAVLLCAAATCAAEGIEAVTIPSKDVTLSFVRPGQIAKVLVKDGQQVKAGELLISQDDSAERVQLEQLRTQATDRTRVRAAEAQLAQKKLDLKKIEDAARSGASTQAEVEHAQLDVTIAELSLELAKLQHEQDGLKLREAELQVARMKLLSPIDGMVERVVVEAGESVDALEKLIRIVKTDPLRIDVPVPGVQAGALASGGKADVTFARTGETVTGTITFVASVADAASETLTVRVELPNPAGRRAGQRVRVSFPEAPAAPRPGETDTHR